MILFVFEGEKREPELFRAIEKLFFKDSQHIVCSFGNNIYELYQRFIWYSIMTSTIGTFCWKR